MNDLAMIKSQDMSILVLPRTMGGRARVRIALFPNMCCAACQDRTPEPSAYMFLPLDQPMSKFWDDRERGHVEVGPFLAYPFINFLQ